MNKIDVVIVSGDLTGLAAAHCLAEAGRQVIPLEQGGVPGSKNLACSIGMAGRGLKQ